jgi:hypothetical protein
MSWVKSRAAEERTMLHSIMQWCFATDVRHRRIATVVKKVP